MGPLFRNHSSTVTRAARPVTETCTALRTFSTAPRGCSIHPCAANVASGRTRLESAATTRRDHMATGSCERREERRGAAVGLHSRGYGAGYVAAWEGVAAG